MKSLNKAFLILLGLVLAAGLFWALRPAPVEVSAVEAERAPFQLTVEEEGRTHLRDTYLVSAPIGGYLHRVSLEPGDAVTAGQSVFELEPPPAPALDARTREQARETLAAAEARLEAARAERENRRADQQLARSELARAQRLFEQSLVAESELERAENVAARARSALAAAEASVEAAGYEVSNARAVLEIAEGERSVEGGGVLQVAAPVGGVVLARQRCCEGPIQAGAPVLEIGRLDDLEVRVDLLSMDAVRVEGGTPVLIEDWGGEAVLEGRVRRVEPAGFMRVSALGVEEQRVPVLVEITSPREQWRALGTGYRVEARFVLWAGDDVLQVPSSALFRQGEDWAVFVVEDGRLSTRIVEPGRESGLMREITDGLTAGERVVAHPSDALADGLRVDPGDA